MSERDSADFSERLSYCRREHNQAVENRPAYGYWCYECERYVRFHEDYLNYSGDEA